MYADSQIRYNFILSFMPTDELQELDSEQISRINSMAMKGGATNSQAATSIMAEVNTNYARTMNKEILHKAIFNLLSDENTGSDLIQLDLKFPEPSNDLIFKSSLAEGVGNRLNREVPMFAMIQISAHDFPKKFSDFCFNSLYIKSEVIEAMVKIRTSCNDLIRSQRLFN